MDLNMKNQNELSIPLNEDELFYKEYHDAVTSPEKLEKFLKQVDLQDAVSRHLVIPELLPDIISYNMDDNEYFDSDNNYSLFISRHNRYTPAFMHRHDFFEIVYVYSGRCNQNIGIKRHSFEAGDMIFISPKVFHTMEVFDDNTLVFNLLLRKSTFHEMFIPLTSGNNLMSEFFSEGLYHTQKLEYLVFHTAGAVNPYISQMCQEQLNRDDCTDQILIGIMTVMLANIMRNYKDTMESSLTTPSAHSNFSKDFMVLNYIQEHLEDVSLSDISNHFGFSVSYCSRLIKSATGMGFNDWKCALRMRRAEHMLLNTAKTVYEISDSLGYVNPETFIRAFKKELHVTPSQYRKHAVCKK